MRPVADGDGVLRWSGRVVSALELERLKREVREIVVEPSTVLTPSAREWLRQRGVSIKSEQRSVRESKASGWLLAQEREFAVVNGVIEALRRDGLRFEPRMKQGSASLIEWSKELAEEIDHDRAHGAVVLSLDPALVCCVANRMSGVRAAAVTTVPQTERALKSLGANWLAIEMPGRSFFELRQMLRLAAVAKVECPPELIGLKKGACACASRK